MRSSLVSRRMKPSEDDMTSYSTERIRFTNFTPKGGAQGDVTLLIFSVIVDFSIQESRENAVFFFCDDSVTGSN
jgi:hypothetical protein